MENEDRHPVPDPPEDYRSEGLARPINQGDPDANEGPANPSDEAEDRPKSPPGGRPLPDDDDDVAVDPEGAPTANGFMTLITVVMLVIVVLVVVTALTEATIMLIVTFIAILVGLGLVLKSLFEMMATD